ncbi:MAG: carbon storage regulator CsrA [Gaiellales bacterium]
MLIVTRRPGERIVIGENVTVAVLEVTSAGVRLGIEAPRSVSVHRAEVYEQIAEQNREAATSGPTDLPDRDGA